MREETHELAASLFQAVFPVIISQVWICISVTDFADDGRGTIARLPANGPGAGWLRDKRRVQGVD